MSEQEQQQLIRVAAPRHGVHLLRNNSGACTDTTGRLVRYGLGNDSAELNRVFKSSDLIGIAPVTIQPHHVGMTIGQFVAVEVKRPGWKFRENDERAVAQRNFGQWVIKQGGRFQFATGPDDMEW